MASPTVGFVGKIRNATSAKNVSGQVAKFKQSSSARTVMDSRVGKAVGKHPYRYGAGAAVGMGAMASGRRRSGLDRPQGRPTGMYGY